MASLFGALGGGGSLAPPSWDPGALPPAATPPGAPMLRRIRNELRQLLESPLPGACGNGRRAGGRLGYPRRLDLRGGHGSAPSFDTSRSLLLRTLPAARAGIVVVPDDDIVTRMHALITGPAGTRA
jgi:hypothetical protein